MTNDIKWLMASDIHFPYHDKRALDLFFKVMKAWKPDAVDYPGDIDNADSTSRWAEGTPGEATSIGDGGVFETRQLFADTREMLPNADIHYHDGNHGWTRHEEYLTKKAPAFLDIVTPEGLYETAKYGVHFHRYDHAPVKRFGDMHVHHGVAISQNAGESVRKDCEKHMISLVRGHSHRMGEYNSTYPMAGIEIRGYEIGHLCDVQKMNYIYAPDWQQGFATAWVVDGYPHIQLIHVNDYTCVVDGKVFRA